MHDIELAILEIFKQEPNKAISTTFFVNKIFSDIKTKEKKARLHRKLLYHLNKLVKDKILAISGVHGKGEKLFVLAFKEGELEIRSGNKRVIIHKPRAISTPIDNIEGIIPYSRSDWLYKFNALLIDANHFESFSSLNEQLLFALSYVNDVIGILRFETMQGTAQEYEDFFEFLEKSTSDYEKRIVLILSLPKSADYSRMIRICKYFTQYHPKNVELIINTLPKEIHTKKSFFSSVIPLFIKNNIKFHIKNSGVHPSPIIYGDAGSYSLSTNDWRSYSENERRSGKGIIIGGSQIAFDIALINKPIHFLSRKAGEALFLTANERLKHLEQLTPLTDKFTFNYINEHIRFWNFDIDDELFFEEIKSSKNVVDEFSKKQELVFRACGMPIRFNILLSSAFIKFGHLSSRQYRKILVRDLHVLQEKKFFDFLTKRELLCRLFESDRIRFFRVKDSVNDIIHELSFLLNTYSLPLITYDFSELQGNVKLTDFFGGER